MKKHLLIAILLLISASLFAQDPPASRPIVKSIIHVASATPPANPIINEKYLNSDGFYYRWNGSTWIVDVVGGGGSTDWGDLTGIPADIADGDDNTQLSQSEVENFYNLQVPIVSQAVAEAGTSTTVYRWTPQRIYQAILALAASGTDDQVAAEVPSTPQGNLVATNVQDALNELQNELDGVSGSTDDQIAGEVPYDNTGSGLLATNVQNAIDELEDEIDGVSAASDSGSDYAPNIENTGTNVVYGNGNVAGAGIANGEKVWNYHTANDTITLGAGITLDEHPFYIQSRLDSVYIKPGASYTLETEDGVLSADGYIAYARKPIFVKRISSAVASNTFFLQGQLTEHTENSYDLQGYNVVLDYNAENLTNGASISSWATDPNSSGTASADQATGSLQPSVVTEGDGHLAVDFDGVDDFLSLGSQSDFDPAIGTDTFAVFVVRGADPGPGGTTGIFSDREGSARDLNIGQTGTSNFIIQVGTSTHQVFESGLSTTAPVLLTVVASTTDVQTYTNGSLGNNDPIGGYNSSTRDFVIGARSDPGSYYGGTVRRIVVVSPAPNATDRAAIEAILTANNM